MHFYLTKLLVALALCAFPLAAFARALPSEKSSLDTRASGDPPAQYNSTTSSLESVSRNAPHIVKKQAAVTWESALKKGKELWALHQEKLSANNPTEKYLDPGLLERIYTWAEGSPNRQANPVNSLYGSLVSDGITTGPVWYRSQLLEKGTPSMSDFENFYFYDEAQQEGVIIAENNARHFSSKSLAWSDIVFIEYSNLHNTESKLRNLKYIYQGTISNTRTGNIIDKAIADYPHQTVTDTCGYVWYSFNPNSEAFFALLGNQNGRGEVHLLIDHPRSFSQRTILEIRVRQGPHSMKFVLGNA